MGKGESPQKVMLKRIAPKQDVPICPNGNDHCRGISMGCKDSPTIGRRYYYCNGPNPKCRPAMVWAPMLPEEEQKRLRDAISIYYPARDAARQSRFKKADKNPGEAPPDSDASSIVKIYVYVSEDDEYIEHSGRLNAGAYSLYSDPVLCNLTAFPETQWDMYDYVQRKFVTLPTFSQQVVSPHEFLILRPTSYSDADCNGLKELIERLAESLSLRSTPKSLGKRKRSESPEAGPSSQGENQRHSKKWNF